MDKKVSNEWATKTKWNINNKSNDVKTEKKYDRQIDQRFISKASKRGC